jgi:hypothetical protein
MDFLPGSLGFDPLAHHLDPVEAATVVWFDALVGNVDRSWRNPNMLMWHRQLWLIDHGACLTFHHAWSRATSWAEKPYDASGHVLHEMATASVSPVLTEEQVRAAVDDVPNVWLTDEPGFDSPAEVRAAYVEQILRRLAR